ncbi:dihydrofolate reductase family protein [Actinoplanes sp. LDG1-06]|uniref:Dihydrofolate reductase family protein n=1 Tax=Paractinoplanes ovalisporus TaxID=2810368 RepID=A0ABS2A688_9ACTN|nr:dihydrofolate reductase family protein [Actinoplanes ovalisporus]
MTVFQSVTLDGVMQAPGRKGEDDRDGFGHAGWADGYADEVSMGFAAEGMRQEGSLLFGRRTYEDLLGFWTTTDQPNPFTDVLVNARKLVVTRSAETTAAYPNTELLVGDAVETVGQHRDENLTIMGSGELIRALHAARMIDTYVLQIHPIVLGSGAKLFADGDRADLRLERSLPTTTGVIIAQYAVR